MGCQAIEDSEIQRRLTDNSLLRRLNSIVCVISELKESVREFYYEVVLSAYRCPQCGGDLHMTGMSKCGCSCGYACDPTISFQESPCCGVKLIRKTYHYVCSRCNNTVPSRFLFDEKVFDLNYFREMMRKSRQHAKEKRDEIRRLLAESRSDTLRDFEAPDLDSVPGLLQDLDGFVKSHTAETCAAFVPDGPQFNMEDYRDHIMSVLGWDGVLFSEITPCVGDTRKDRAYRFITLIFMQNEREVEIDQQENDLLVQKKCHETYG